MCWEWEQNKESAKELENIRKSFGRSSGILPRKKRHHFLRIDEREEREYIIKARDTRGPVLATNGLLFGAHLNNKRKRNDVLSEEYK